MQLNSAHWLAIGMFLTSIAAQIGGLQHGWQDALTPAFISGIVLNAGSVIIAVASGSPFKNGKDNEKVNSSSANPNAH